MKLWKQGMYAGIVALSLMSTPLFAQENRREAAAEKNEQNAEQRQNLRRLFHKFLEDKGITDPSTLSEEEWDRLWKAFRESLSEEHGANLRRLFHKFLEDQGVSDPSSLTEEQLARYWAAFRKAMWGQENNTENASANRENAERGGDAARGGDAPKRGGDAARGGDAPKRGGGSERESDSRRGGEQR